MEHKLNPILIMATALAVAGISLYINYVSYRNLLFGKMLIFLIIGGLMFLYGGARHLLEKPKQHALLTHHTARRAPSSADHRHPANNCPHCGARIVPHGQFCYQCGRRLH